MSSLQKKQGFDMVILMITDVLLEGTQLLFVGDRDSIRQAFNVEDAEDVVFLPKVMSRKSRSFPCSPPCGAEERVAPPPGAFC